MGERRSPHVAANVCNILSVVIEFEGPQNIAAILMEGESGSSGCIKYPPDYLQKVRALCDKA
jgi:taurine--2-oxoglutarate transaminase